MLQGFSGLRLTRLILLRKQAGIYRNEQQDFTFGDTVSGVWFENGIQKIRFWDKMVLSVEGWSNRSARLPTFDGEEYIFIVVNDTISY